jgi:hypothetical protein
MIALSLPTEEDNCLGIRCSGTNFAQDPVRAEKRQFNPVFAVMSYRGVEFGIHSFSVCALDWG